MSGGGRAKQYRVPKGINLGSLKSTTKTSKNIHFSSFHSYHVLHVHQFIPILIAALKLRLITLTLVFQLTKLSNSSE